MRIEGIEHKDEVLNLNEAADFMRISRRTLHSLIADGIGPPTLTIGRRRLIRRTALESWLRDREGAGHDRAA
ncbi:MAG: helix-turn-helix domain-containing protein [Oceanicaulis sp.]|nr:helix-turn-helix domain-containing protein [Oceanicaulis sp.]